MQQNLHLPPLEDQAQLGKRHPEERLELRDHGLPNQEPPGEQLLDEQRDLGQHEHLKQRNQNELLVKESGNECAG